MKADSALHGRIDEVEEARNELASYYKQFVQNTMALGFAPSERVDPFQIVNFQA